MTPIFDAIIRGELVVVLLMAAICMGTWLGRQRR